MLKSLIIRPLFALFKNIHFLIFLFIALTLVFFRMKSVEQEYRTTEITSSINKVLSENKDLKAIKAQSLSTRNLIELAKKYNMRNPESSRIIVLK